MLRCAFDASQPTGLSQKPQPPYSMPEVYFTLYHEGDSEGRPALKARLPYPQKYWTAENLAPGRYKAVIVHEHPDVTLTTDTVEIKVGETAELTSQIELPDVQAYYQKLQRNSLDEMRQQRERMDQEYLSRSGHPAAGQKPLQRIGAKQGGSLSSLSFHVQVSPKDVEVCAA